MHVEIPVAEATRYGRSIVPYCITYTMVQYTLQKILGLTSSWLLRPWCKISLYAFFDEFFRMFNSCIYCLPSPNVNLSTYMWLHSINAPNLLTYLLTYLVPVVEKTCCAACATMKLRAIIMFTTRTNPNALCTTETFNGRAYGTR